MNEAFKHKRDYSYLKYDPTYPDTVHMEILSKELSRDECLYALSLMGDKESPPAEQPKPTLEGPHWSYAEKYGDYRVMKCILELRAVVRELQETVHNLEAKYRPHPQENVELSD